MSGSESGSGVDTAGPQPADATPTNPWPVPADLVNAIMLEVQTRFRLLAMDNLRPNLTPDEIACALYDAVDTLNNAPPQTRFTIDQLFTPGSDPRFRSVYYLCVAKHLLITLVFDWTSNSFDQTMNNFTVTSKLADYQQLLSSITEQLDAQLDKLKVGSQRFIARVTPRNQSLIRTFGNAYTSRPLGGRGLWGSSS